MLHRIPRERKERGGAEKWAFSAVSEALGRVHVPPAQNVGPKRNNKHPKAKMRRSKI